MKKLFEIPKLKVVRFEEADIIITSGCGTWWYCDCYTCNAYYPDPDNCASYTEDKCQHYEQNSPIDGCNYYNDFTYDT